MQSAVVISISRDELEQAISDCEREKLLWQGEQRAYQKMLMRLAQAEKQKQEEVQVMDSDR